MQLPIFWIESHVQEFDVNKNVERGNSHKSPAECIHVHSVHIYCILWHSQCPFCLIHRWRSVFGLRIWNWLSPYWNKCFFTMIMVLIVLFLGKQSAVSDSYGITQSRLTACCKSSQHRSCFCPPAHSQMLSGRFRSTRVLSLCMMPRWTQICTIRSTWSCSEPRGTSTYLASLSSSGCQCHFFPHFFQNNRLMC